MARRKSVLHRRDRTPHTPSAVGGADARGIGAKLTLPPIDKSVRKSIKGMLKDLTAAHSTEVSMRLREGMTSRNLRLALKYIAFAAAYVDGKPVETHRMVADASENSGYDLDRLSAAEKKALLAMLKKSRDAGKR